MADPGSGHDGLYQVQRLGSGAAEALEGIRERGGCVFDTTDHTMQVCAGNGRLLSVHGPELAPTPFSACLTTTPTEWPAIGTRIAAGDQSLQVGSWRIGLPSAVADLIGQREPTTTRESAVGPYDWGEAARALEPWAAQSSFGRWWQADQAADDAGPAQLGAQRIRRLVRNVRTSDSEGAWQNTRGLLGAKIGESSGGDDVLMGLFGAWSYLAPPTLRVHLAERLLSRAAGLAPSATTPVNAELFYHLARGRRGELFDELLSAVLVGNRDDTDRAAAALAESRTTPGHDCVAGVLGLVLAAGEDGLPW